MTLDKRIELHERSRDIAEQNVENELEGLKEALKVSAINTGYLNLSNRQCQAKETQLEFMILVYPAGGRGQLWMLSIVGMGVQFPRHYWTRS